MDNLTQPSIYSEIYKQLNQLIPDLLSLELGKGLKSHSKNSMVLNLDVLNKNEEQIIIALSHYREHELRSGDLVPDPDMEIRIFPKRSIAEALTYQDGFTLKSVYINKDHFYPKRKKELNLFLYRWLKSCLAGGHQFRQ
jgi:uncharacterized protein YqiB (DUF1249 family)